MPSGVGAGLQGRTERRRRDGRAGAGGRIAGRFGAGSCGCPERWPDRHDRSADGDGIPYPALGWHFLHRADLIDILANGAREAGAQIRLLHKVSVDLSATLVDDAAQGAEFLPGVLIRADGLHSLTRAAFKRGWRAVLYRASCTAGGGARDARSEPVAVHMGPGRHLVGYPLRGGRWRNIVAVEERKHGFRKLVVTR